jgi:hypothetical protein
MISITIRSRSTSFSRSQLQKWKSKTPNTNAYQKAYPHHEPVEQKQNGYNDQPNTQAYPSQPNNEKKRIFKRNYLI